MDVYRDVLPKWSRELSAKGYKGVCAIDFYDDLFGDDLAEQRVPEDYRNGEYCGIAVEMVLKVDKEGNPILDDKGRKQWQGLRTQVTQGNMELYDLIDRSDNFCLIAPFSYAGRSRTNENARYMYAFCIEVDGIQERGGLEELIYSWERKNQPIPKPTYMVCSGNGLHLYYVFERPIPMWRNVFEAMAEYKKYITPRLWTKYITSEYEKIQWQSVNQPFRVVGTRTKDQGYVLAFRIGEKVTVDYMNQFVPKDRAMTCIYKPKCSLKEAKELYPEWYNRRIEKKEDRGYWNRYQPIYYNWIEKILEGAVVGKRYNCLENLCSLAVQCNIEPEQVEADCKRVAEYFETLTVEEDNHFTDYDVLCALKTYHQAKYTAYTRKIEFISKKTGIELIPNKRRKVPLKRDDGTALKAARMIQNLQDPEGKWRNKEGRPSAEDRILMYLYENPEATKKKIKEDTGLSYPTIRKYYDKCRRAVLISLTTEDMLQEALDQDAKNWLRQCREEERIGKKKSIMNILSYEEKNFEKVNCFEFECRGCSMMNREERWNGYISSISRKLDRESDNSYLTLEEEPENKYDPNAIKVVVRGEFFGIVGYVGKEYTAKIKQILYSCEKYRIDMKDVNQCGSKTVDLILSWMENRREENK